MSKRKARSKAPADIRDPAKQRPPLPIPSILQILVECESERRQQDLFERLQQEGYSCRVLTL